MVGSERGKTDRGFVLPLAIIVALGKRDLTALN